MAERKTKRRKLTPFLCQEMLFEYALDRLDNNRKQAVEDFLKSDQECREILAGIQSAISYSAGLRKTQVRADLLTHLRDAENAVSLGRKYASWKEWPDTLRWSIAALLISVVVAGFVAIVPWHQLPSLTTKSPSSSVLELADLSRSENPEEAENSPEAHDNNDVADNDQGSGDEEMDVAAGAPPSPPLPGPTPAAPVVEGGSGAEAGAAAQTPVARKEPKPRGFVYRAFMNLGNLDEVGPRIADHISELGGSKAGEVELGWQRGSGRYYHFSLPAENEEKLLENLRAYGPVRISKDPHSRVMPEGQVRFILWVEPL